MKKLINKITALKSAAGDVQSEVEKSIQKREEHLQRREDLHTLAPSRGEVKTTIFKIFDEQAKEYLDRLQREINAKFFLRDSMKPPATISVLAPHCDGPPHTVIASSLLALLGPQLKEGIARVIDNLDWPEEVGPPFEERKNELITIDQEIGEIEDELAELNSAARESGVELTGIALPEKSKP